MKPILCNYYITYRCNARCDFCDIQKTYGKKIKADCSFEDLKKNLPQLKSAGIKFIDLTGGEPLLHQQLPDMLRAAKNYGFFTSVTTNCLLYPKRAADLVGLVGLLHFSLDSLDEDENDSIRGKGSYAKVMESIEITKKLGERPDLLFTVTESNYKAIDELANFAQEQKLILIVNPIFKYNKQQQITIETLDYIEQFQKSPYVYQNRALHRLIRSKGNKRAIPRCRAVTSTIVISPNNKVLFPCFHFQQLAMPIKDNLKQVRKSKMAKLFKKQQGTYPFCEGCTINCYFDPSFLYKIDSYFWLSLRSKIKYGIDKFLRSLPFTWQKKNA
ncbi:radical SAM protein [candidate division KSB1 bacterium]|nr:radical SAM protein [candidate division KSB1 bacterium]MBL7094627.1 radical SAM protein [candidate division KSB1 bacterium]